MGCSNMDDGRRRRGADQPGGAEPIDRAPLYLEEEPERLPRLRGTVVLRTGAVAVVVAAVAVPAVLLGTNVGNRTAAPPTSTSTPSPRGAQGGTHVVLSALSATTASGSFDMSYQLTQTAPPSSSSTTTTTTCAPVMVTGGTGSSAFVPPSTASNGGVPATTPATTCFYPAPTQLAMVTGTGVIDVTPYAMVATATIGSEGSGGNAAAGLSVSVRVDSTSVWELSAGDGGLAPTPADDRAGSGETLSQFSSLVDTSLGRRAGPAAVLAMASPTGYLDLAQNEVTSADEVGTGTVDGQAVTTYAVPITPAAEASLPGTSTEQRAAISLALAQLASQGYTGTTDFVSVGSSGYILASKAIAHFNDGATVTLATNFSDFGCAGRVLMPGQQGSGVPPAGCTSPVAPVSTATAPTSSATSGASAASRTTTAPPAPTSTSAAVPTTTTATTG